MRILITGGNGFIGSHLAKTLEPHNKIYIYDKRGHTDMSEIFSLPPDMVIHCDAKTIIRECIDDPVSTHHRNATQTQMILDLCRQTGVRKFVYFSSSRVLYGDNNIYTATKKYGELLCQAYKENYHIDYLIIRPSTVFGPGDRSFRLIPRWIRKSINNEDITIYGNQLKTLDITYIDDFIAAFMRILASEWNTDYNISNARGVLLYNLAQYIIDEVGSKSKIIFADAEHSQPQKVQVDNSKILEIGYRPPLDWKPGVKETIKWIQSIL